MQNIETKRRMYAIFAPHVAKVQFITPQNVNYRIHAKNYCLPLCMNPWESVKHTYMWIFVTAEVAVGFLRSYIEQFVLFHYGIRHTIVN